MSTLLLLGLWACGSMDSAVQPVQPQPSVIQRAREFVVGVDPQVCAGRRKYPVRTGIGWTCGAAVTPAADGGLTFTHSVPRSGDAPGQVIFNVGQVGPAVQVGPLLGGGR